MNWTGTTPEQHSAKIRDSAIANAKRILEAYGYQVEYRPFRCTCGRRFGSAFGLNLHFRWFQNWHSHKVCDHQDATPTGEPQL